MLNIKITTRLFLFFIGATFFFTSCDALKSNCENCNGTGKINCFTCNGTGKSNCSWCFGEGKKSCSQCFGMGRKSTFIGGKDGYQFVNAPGFNGYTQVIGGSINVPCQTCNGVGKQECANVACNNGKVKCLNFSCKEGKIDCLVCEGKGKK